MHPDSAIARSGNIRSLAAWPMFAALFSAGVVLALIADALFRGSTAAVGPVLGYLLAAAAIWLGAYLLRKHLPAVASFIRFFLPLILYGAFYTHVHAMMTAAHPYIVDDALAAIDRSLFGTEPIAWLGTHGHPLLTDILYLCYFSYYLGMPILLLLMWRRNREEDFRAALSAMAIGWYGALISYALFPALGPQRFMPSELPVLTGWLPTTPWIQSFLAGNLASNLVRDCVPSMHTGVTLLTLTFAWRFQRNYFFILLLPALGLIAGTMYLQQHYVIDVLLGIAAFGVIYVTVVTLKPR